MENDKRLSQKGVLSDRFGFGVREISEPPAHARGGVSTPVLVVFVGR